MLVCRGKHDTSPPASANVTTRCIDEEEGKAKYLLRKASFYTFAVLVITAYVCSSLEYRSYKLVYIKANMNLNY